MNLAFMAPAIREDPMIMQPGSQESESGSLQEVGSIRNAILSATSYEFMLELTRSIFQYLISKVAS
jgi:hypothetical protein